MKKLMVVLLLVVSALVFALPPAPDPSERVASLKVDCVLMFPDGSGVVLPAGTVLMDGTLWQEIVDYVIAVESERRESIEERKPGAGRPVGVSVGRPDRDEDDLRAGETAALRGL